MRKFITELSKVWYLLAFVIAIILWYGSVNYRLNSVEAKQTENEKTLIELMKIKTDVEVIKSKVDFIYQRVQ